MGRFTSGLQRLGPGDRRCVESFLTQRAPYNVYLLAQIARGALTRDDVAGPLVGYRGRTGALEAVGICGSNLALSYPSSPTGLDAIADYTRRGGYLAQVIVGEDRTVDHFMTRYGRDARPLALERGGQHLFAVAEAPLAPRRVRLRRADTRELGAVMEADRAMVLEELGFDAFAGAEDAYRAGWLRRIREGRAWVVSQPGGEVLFKAEISALSDHAAQVSGVWTAPPWRRQGVALDAMAQVLGSLLAEVPLVTLYVHAGNAGAVRLYERLGFDRVGAVRTVWFGD